MFSIIILSSLYVRNGITQDTYTGYKSIKKSVKILSKDIEIDTQTLVDNTTFHFAQTYKIDHFTYTIFFESFSMNLSQKAQADISQTLHKIDLQTMNTKKYDISDKPISYTPMPFWFWKDLIIYKTINSGLAIYRKSSTTATIFPSVGVHIDFFFDGVDDDSILLLKDFSGLYVINWKDKNWKFITSILHKPIWHASLKWWWILIKDGITMKLYYMSKDELHPRILDETTKFGVIDNVLWFEQSIHGNLFLKFYNGDGVKIAQFPGKGNYKFMAGIFIRGDHVMLALINLLDELLLWHGTLPDLKFSSVLTRITVDDRMPATMEVVVIKEFPAVWFMTLTYYFENIRNNITLISYNEGSVWIPVTTHRRISGQICIYPNCRVVINKLKSIEYNSANPAIMIARGRILISNMPYHDGFLISKDGGLTWKKIGMDLLDLKIIYDGPILVGISVDPNHVYVSVDFGKSFTNLNFGYSNRKYLELIYNPLQNKYSILIVMLDNQHQYAIISLNFTSFLEKTCHKSDYSSYYPAPTPDTECYRGYIKYRYTKKFEKDCQEFSNILLSANIIECPCFKKDYKCAFNYVSINGECFREFDRYQPHSYPLCKAETDIKSITRQIPKNDHCFVSKFDQKYSTRSCSFQFKELLFVYLSHNVLKLFSAIPPHVKRTHRLAKAYQHDQKIKALCFDVYDQSLYLLVDTGIIRKFIERTSSEKSTEEYVVKKYNIQGFSFDVHTHYLYYFTKNSVIVINLKKSVMKTLYSTKEALYYMNINLKAGILFVSSFMTSNNDHLVEVVKLSGSLIARKLFPNKIHGIDFDDDNNYILISHQHFHKYNSDFKLISNTVLIKQNLMNIMESGSKQYYIYENGLSIAHKFYLLKNIDYGYVSEPMHDDIIHFCKFSGCSHFCFFNPVNGSMCECSDDMEYSKVDGTCVCKKNNPICTECEKQQYRCRNKKCISNKLVCNGKNDCSDNSDEDNCNIICKTNEIYCDNKQCVNYGNICDKIKHCWDGTDENFCIEEQPTCSVDEFECLENKCIPQKERCDGKVDCADGKDEENCQQYKCEKKGVMCDNGQCISKEQLCNGIFDCLDLSDERSCHPRALRLIDNDCLLKCNQKCVPTNKICDHFIDCPDGSDEHDCGHESFCASDLFNICDDKSACYEASRECDGFYDCADLSDELYCDKQTCNALSVDVCGGGETLCRNKFCDGIYDCPDMSDESEICLKTIYPEKLYVETPRSGNALISWTTNKPGEGAFNFTLMDYHSNRVHFHKIQSEQNITVTGLRNCVRYHIGVGSPENIYRIHSFMYVEKDQKMPIPNDLKYDYIRKLLSWSVSLNECRPRTFYIDCQKNGRAAFINFSQHLNFHMKLTLKMECRVASCPFSIFNSSCSRFSRSIHIDSFKYAPFDHLFLFGFCLLVYLCTYILRSHGGGKTIEHILLKRLQFYIKQKTKASKEKYVFDKDDEDIL